MKTLVLDSESDGLAYECTKLHILSWTEDGKNYHSTADYDHMRAVVESADLLVAHNSIRHDMVVFNRILGLPMDYRKWVDTLALSWFLYPDRNKHGLGAWGDDLGDRNKHGLGAWGDDLGVEKPTVENWTDVTYEQMRHRCESDVKINWLLWQRMKKRLEEIYES